MMLALHIDGRRTHERTSLLPHAPQKCGDNDKNFITLIRLPVALERLLISYGDLHKYTAFKIYLCNE